ncbi:FxLYD domain-containing protein [Steroidobacter cummioxidans]|uniref:FxLYD domain-containing protein n=1 Tax=Steroidobacter cummioxidans TaxID=1803913 RepID=UPI0039C96943
MGSIENIGQDTWQSVELLVELFDKGGTFVDKCSSHLDGSIEPGQTRNFKVSCSECRSSSLPLAYDRYTVAIASAYYVQPDAGR